MILNTLTDRKSTRLDNILDKSLTAWEKLYGAEPSERSFSLRFAGIIERSIKRL